MGLFKTSITQKFTKNFKPPIIPKAQGNRYVISDIHGCVSTLKKLISKIQLTPQDQLFFLGDYIDRGVSSSGVLDYIIQLKQEFSVYCLMGNHEWMLLQTVEENNQAQYAARAGCKDLLLKGKLEQKYLDFFMDTYFYIQIENIYLVHAGFNLLAAKPKTPFTDYYAMLWQREPAYDLALSAHFKDKFVVCGHTPRLMNDIQEAIEKKKTIIPLDNGCVFSDEEIYGIGNLCCLKLDTFELISEPNADTILNY